jgi:hypothetical protein
LESLTLKAKCILVLFIGLIAVPHIYAQNPAPAERSPSPRTSARAVIQTGAGLAVYRASRSLPRLQAAAVNLVTKIDPDLDDARLAALQAKRGYETLHERFNRLAGNRSNPELARLRGAELQALTQSIDDNVIAIDGMNRRIRIAESLEKTIRQNLNNRLNGPIRMTGRAGRVAGAAAAIYGLAVLVGQMAGIEVGQSVSDRMSRLGSSSSTSATSATQPSATPLQ